MFPIAAAAAAGAGRGRRSREGGKVGQRLQRRSPAVASSHQQRPGKRHVPRGDEAAAAAAVTPARRLPLRPAAHASRLAPPRGSLMLLLGQALLQSRATLAAGGAAAAAAALVAAPSPAAVALHLRGWPRSPPCLPPASARTEEEEEALQPQPLPQQQQQPPRLPLARTVPVQGGGDVGLRASADSRRGRAGRSRREGAQADGVPRLLRGRESEGGIPAGQGKPLRRLRGMRAAAAAAPSSCCCGRPGRKHG